MSIGYPLLLCIFIVLYSLQTHKPLLYIRIYIHGQCACVLVWQYMSCNCTVMMKVLFVLSIHCSILVMCTCLFEAMVHSTNVCTTSSMICCAVVCVSCTVRNTWTTVRMYMLIMLVNCSVGSFNIRTSCCVCSVKPEDRPRIAAPVVAVAIEEPYQLADSLADNPVRIKFEVNQHNNSHTRCSWFAVLLHLPCTVDVAFVLWTVHCIACCLPYLMCVVVSTYAVYILRVIYMGWMEWWTGLLYIVFTQYFLCIASHRKLIYKLLHLSLCRMESL